MLPLLYRTVPELVYSLFSSAVHNNKNITKLLVSIPTPELAKELSKYAVAASKMTPCLLNTACYLPFAIL